MAIREFFYRQRWLFLIFILGFLLFFYKVGERDLWAPDEDEYAQVSREMVQLNHWAYPTVNNKPYTIKPVLFNWLIALISLPSGDVNEFRARIFSSIAALGTVIIVFYLGTLMFTSRAGFLGALILGTSVLFIQYARWVQINMLATFFIMLTLFLFYRGYISPEKRRVSDLLMYIPIGLGVLTMGPVNLVLPALVIGLYLLVQRDLNHLKKLELVWGALIALAIILPYYLIVSLKGEYAFNLLLKTNIIRYFDTWTHKRPFYYYLPNLLWAFLPWALFLPGAFYYAFSQGWKEKRREKNFLMVWVVGIFIFFSFSQCKRIQYLLPLFPALALLVAYLGDQYLSHRNDPFNKKMIIVPSFVFLAVLSLAALGLPLYALLAQRAWLWEMVAIGAICAATTLFIAWAFRKNMPGLLFIAPGIFILVILTYSVRYVIPKVEPYKSPRPFCQQIVAHLENGGQWAMYEFFRPAYVYYTNRFCEVLLNGPELRAFLEEGRPSLVVIREKDYKRIKNNLDVRTRVLFREKIGHRSLLLISNQRES